MKSCLICQRQTEPCDQYRDGICRLLDAQMQSHVDALMRFRTNESPLAQTDISDYNTLPFSMKNSDFQWRMRSHDVSNVLRLLKDRRNQTILEIGPWNGWLTHHIVRAGHHIIAIAYSADTKNGLGSKSHYDVDWHAVQMDISDLSIVQSKVDVVIVNHGLHLYPNPVEYVQSLIELVNPGGLLIILGMVFHRDPSRQRAHIAAQDKACRKAVGVPYLLNGGDGCMDFNDLHALRDLGISMRRYHGMWRSELKAVIKRTAPVYRWAVYDFP